MISTRSFADAVTGDNARMDNERKRTGKDRTAAYRARLAESREPPAWRQSSAT
jgi:hypothetical protein